MSLHLTCVGRAAPSIILLCASGCRSPIGYLLCFPTFSAQFRRLFRLSPALVSFPSVHGSVPSALTGASPQRQPIQHIPDRGVPVAPFMAGIRRLHAGQVDAALELAAEIAVQPDIEVVCPAALVKPRQSSPRSQMLLQHMSQVVRTAVILLRRAEGQHRHPQHSGVADRRLSRQPCPLAEAAGQARHGSEPLRTTDAELEGAISAHRQAGSEPILPPVRQAEEAARHRRQLLGQKSEVRQPHFLVGVEAQMNRRHDDGNALLLRIALDRGEPLPVRMVVRRSVQQIEHRIRRALLQPAPRPDRRCLLRKDSGE
ncbi:hypothetical protein BN871_HY_00060 [Paenibacillus sp. P22]|nr:hypothetical protein BN871_HY_00060 [Paenibacillus sp. P22]